MIGKFKNENTFYSMKNDFGFLIFPFSFKSVKMQLIMHILGRTGKQFFINYVVFFICLIILFVPLYQVNLSMVSKTYRDTSASLLETGLNNLEMEINHIETMAMAVYNSPYFRHLSYLSAEMELMEYYYAMSLVVDFKRYFAATDLIADCGIFFKNNMILTSKRLHFPEEQFYGDYFLQSGILNQEQWFGKMPQKNGTSGFMPNDFFITAEGSY